MRIKETYKPRCIRFLERYQHDEWTLKIYSISYKNERVDQSNVEEAKIHLTEWLSKSKVYGLEIYSIATMIVHEGKEGFYVILNWWIDENMMQNFVYLKKYSEPEFVLYSDRGMTTCVWELEVIWHERNAWVKHVLMQHENPDVEAYLSDQLNNDF